jgi:hypothetical protein
MSLRALVRRPGVRRLVVAVVVGPLLLVAALALATSTAVSLQGVDFVITARPLPLYVKAVDFVHRHEHYRLLAREITAGLTGDRERAEAVLAWTLREIRPIPEGFPVVDDHVFDIIVRRYGSTDQRADVFTVLLTYAGVPAYWKSVKGGAMPGLHTYARIDGQWLLADLHGRSGFTVPPPPLAAAPPRPLRAELQMPWPRVVHEARQRIGW